jgi:hypothetical protein
MSFGRFKKTPSSGEAKTVAKIDHPKKKIIFFTGMNRMTATTSFHAPRAFELS